MTNLSEVLKTGTIFPRGGGQAAKAGFTSSGGQKKSPAKAGQEAV